MSSLRSSKGCLTASYQASGASRHLSWLAVALWLCGACGAAAPSTHGGQGNGNGSGDGTGAGTGATVDGAGGSFGNGSAGTSGVLVPLTDGGLDGGMTCAGASNQAKSKPVDVYIMMDQSASMIAPAGTGTRWSSVTDAMKMFLASPEAAGLGVGIQYFGLGISCTASDYANPEVEIGPLPDNAAALLGSIGMHGPIATTPTQPALDGAIMHAQQWQTAHPDHVVSVVLATDGEPDACGSTTASVAMSAATGLAATPSIHTYVIGVGSGLQALDQVAQSGGTDKALIVDTGADASQQFLDALNKIRKSAVLPCQYTIPADTSGGKVDIEKVNVSFTPSTGASMGKPQIILRAPDASKCDAAKGGWYYDDPNAPKTIQLCPASCTTVTQDADAKLDIVLGCKTQVVVVN